jgi:hypothetical protein
MKKLMKRLPWVWICCCLLTACKPSPIHFTSDEICDLAGQCLPLDAQHAVAVTMVDGKLELTPLPAETVLEGGKDYAAVQDLLRQLDKTLPFASEGTTLRPEGEVLVAGLADGTALRLGKANFTEGCVVVLAGPTGMTMSLVSRFEFSLLEGAIELTDNLRNTIPGDLPQQGACRILLTRCIGDGTSEWALMRKGLGVVILEDDIHDPNFRLRIPVKGGIGRLVAQLQATGVLKSSRDQLLVDAVQIAQPLMGQSSLPLLPSDITSIATPEPCGALDISTEVLRFKLADSRVFYQKFRNRLVVQKASGEQVSYVLPLAGVCSDYCFSVEDGDVVVRAAAGCPPIVAEIF